MSDLSDKKLTRRQILGAAGAAWAFPAIVPSSVFGKNAPSNRITIGMIGMGRQAIYANTNPFLYSEDCQVVAVCDVDKWRLENARKKVDEFYKNTDCKTYTDWREVIARDDIDAIMNSTTDQWHVPISLAAVRKGKHVSCEKPLTLSIAEGRILADEVKKKGVVFRIKYKESDRRLPQRMDKEDFIYAIKNKCNTMADAEVGHRTCSLGQLGHIAIQRGAKLNWDPKAERFIDDDKANKMLYISYRKPWGLLK